MGGLETHLSSQSQGVVFQRPNSGVKETVFKKLFFPYVKTVQFIK